MLEFNKPNIESIKSRLYQAAKISPCGKACYFGVDELLAARELVATGEFVLEELVPAEEGLIPDGCIKMVGSGGGK